jgi:hypothetical protein
LTNDALIATSAGAAGNYRDHRECAGLWHAGGALKYFDPSVESQLVLMRHKDGLRFSDVTTEIDPPPALMRFFERTLRQHASAFRERFEAHRELLERYAVELELRTMNLAVMTGEKYSRSFDENYSHRKS